MLYINSDRLSLIAWGGTAEDVAGDGVAIALKSLENKTAVREFVEELAKSLSSYDWRASDAPGLDEEQSLLKAAFRGSGGYRELRRHVLKHLADSAGEIRTSARKILSALGE